METWTGFTAVAVQKHLQELYPATYRGHMKRQRKGLRSTTTIPDIKSHKTKVNSALERIEIEQDIKPPQAVETQNKIFCYNRLTNRKYGTIYVDFTGKLPIGSMDGMVAIFIVYDWTTNAIIETPVKNMKEETTVEHFKKNIEYLSRKISNQY